MSNSPSLDPWTQSEPTRPYCTAFPVWKLLGMQQFSFWIIRQLGRVEGRLIEVVRIHEGERMDELDRRLMRRSRDAEGREASFGSPELDTEGSGHSAPLDGQVGRTALA